MKSPYTYFVDEFRLRVFFRLQAAPGVYQHFRENILPYLSSSSFHYWSEYFFDAWRKQIPPHQEQYLQLKTIQVPLEYCKFLLLQFDDWFAHHYQDLTSGHPGSFFCLKTYFTNIVCDYIFTYFFCLSGL